VEHWLGGRLRIGGTRGRGGLLGIAVVGLLLVAGASAASPATRPARPLFGSAARLAPATRFGHIRGIVLARGSHALQNARAFHRVTPNGGVAGAGPGQGLGSGLLSYHGGPVMRADTTYAIYWIPSGYSVSAGYESLIDGFFQNVASASGQADNIYSVTAQYADTTGPTAYQSSFGGAAVDTNPFPANGCTDGSLPVCLTDSQLQAEIDKEIKAKGWQAGLSHEFFLFTPSPVGSCTDSSSSTCAYSYYCAYHGSFASSLGNGTVLYANMAYAAQPADPGACDEFERPNGDDADPTINLISHEQAESISDPLGNAWYDDQGYEIGDKCAWMFGQPLGSTGGSGTSTDYNEQIGSGKYYLQEEWSNQTIDSTSWEPGSCVQRDMPQLVLTGPGNGSVSGSGGLACTSVPCDLSAQVGATVTLTAHPASGSSFVGWHGACSGVGTCTVTVTPTTSVLARFETTKLPAGWAEEPLTPPSAFQSLLQGMNPQFGFFRVAEAASGNERAITAFSGDTSCPVGTASHSGGIFLQRQTDSGWVADGTLAAPSVGSDEWRYWPSCSEFGAEISLSADGSTLLASQVMPLVGTGYRCAAFVYQRAATGWSLAATLFPPGIGPSGSPTWSGCDYFGINSTLSADGQRAVVLSAGRVDVFVRGSSGWTLERDLVQPTGNNCGFTVGPPRIAISADGSRLLVGAPDCNVAGAGFAGQVYDYERSGSTWSLAQTIDTPEPVYNNYFGWSVALSSDGDTAVISTQDTTDLPLFAGAVWVYEHDGGGWQERVRLTTPAPRMYDLLTCPQVESNGSQIVCTAFDTVGFDHAQGSIYIFQRPGTSWTSIPAPLRLFAGEGHIEDNLGAGHGAFTWFNPASVAAPAAGGDIATTIAAQNVGLYGYDRIGYEFTTAPVVRSFSPSAGIAGTKVTIKGANFSNASAVKLDGTATASFTLDSPTQITATVPSTATTGTIGVTTPNGSGWSSSSFSPLPTLGSFSPRRGVAGTRVTITGSNLAEASAVSFNRVRARSFRVLSPTQITARVPATATTGKLHVVTPAGSTSSTTPFKPLPAVASVSPDHGRARATIRIKGTNLSATRTVRFAGRKAHFTVRFPTLILARVPKQAGIGRVRVITRAGRATSRSKFKPLPSITAVKPWTAVAGATVTITGANLRGVISVKFRGIRALISAKSPTRIIAIVPGAATTGRITVRTRTGKAATRRRFRPLH
jgi:hypothetical protein